MGVNITDNKITWQKKSNNVYECSRCGGKMDFRHNYCPFCGGEATNPYFDESLDDDD